MVCERRGGAARTGFQGGLGASGRLTLVSTGTWPLTATCTSQTSKRKCRSAGGGPRLGCGCEGCANLKHGYGGG